MTSFVRESTRRLRGLSALSLRYCLYRLSGRRLHARDTHEFSQISVISPRLRRLEGMISMSERAYLQWFAKHVFENHGAIVDLGSWLGSTTIPLAMGLVQNAKVDPRLKCIFAYDSFIWRTWMEPNVAGTPLMGKYRDGESFLGEFEKRTESWRERIHVRAGDLLELDWDGGAIEFLLVDAMKSWDLANRVIKSFYPSLVPGRSRVFHQDFAHWFTPWIHLTHYRLRHYFVPEYDIPRSTSVVFRLREPMAPELLAGHYSADSFTADEVHAAFDYSMSVVGPDKRANVAAAKIMHFVHTGDLDQARRELEKCRAQVMDFASDLAFVEQRLLTASTEAS